MHLQVNAQGILCLPYLFKWVKECLYIGVIIQNDLKKNLYIQISVFKQPKKKTECMYHRLENIQLIYIKSEIF